MLMTNTVTTDGGAISRLEALAPLDDADRHALRLAAQNPQRLPVSRDLIAAGHPLAGRVIVLDGWLGRIRLFSDGRRQILGFLVTGDVIPEPDTAEARATSTITALCDAVIAPAPLIGSGGLARAYAVSRTLDETYLHRHIARLGRMTAYERILDWFMEMHERLTLAGRTEPASLPMPLTQETLADALGLTSVHVNRTLQSMRRNGTIEWRGGIVRFRGRVPVPATGPADAPATHPTMPTA